MKVGIIGLGSICEKAYLPIITAKENIELIFCTRNIERLEGLSRKYRVKSYVSTLEELIDLGIDAAFVHTSTESHVEIVEKLINSGIHVYVDKPLSYSYVEALKVAELSKQAGKILMVGFNRRFAPMYRALKENGKPDIIIMEKNRVAHPGETRTFIFDDFIHVVDTLRFLIGGEVRDIQVKGLKKQGLLNNVVIGLSNDNTSAVGIMNRDNGATEEVVEYMSSGNKLVVKDLVNTTHLKEDRESLIKFKDWDPILYRRGFYDVVEAFLKAVESKTQCYPSIEDSLITHKLCEEIVNKLDE